MKLFARVMAVLIGTALWAGSATAAEEKVPAGQKLFLDYKCNSCHTINALKIDVRKSEEAEEEEAAEKETKKKEPKDLSGAGIERKTEWLEGWLLKKELVEGKKHKKKFRGTAEEVKTIAAWLATLKTKSEEKGAAKPEKKEG